MRAEQPRASQQQHSRQLNRAPSGALFAPGVLGKERLPKGSLRPSDTRTMESRIRAATRTRCSARPPLRLAVAFGAALLLVLGEGELGPPAQGLAARRPNVLIIVTDDQRDGLSVMPATRRWFGRGGTIFNRAYATTPLCCPARASIMTGRYAHNHGVRGNADGDKLNTRTTLQSQLRRAGYTTAIYGKYLNNYDISVPPPHFDRFGIFCCTPNETPEAYVGGEWNVDGRLRTVQQYSTDYIADRAATFISNHSEPWLMYLTPPAPHRPFTPSRSYRNASVRAWGGNRATREQDRSDKPSYVQAAARTLQEGQRQRIAQFRTLMSVDDLVERVSRSLRRAGETNTLAFFVSDNGYLWSEHGLIGKPFPYTKSIRVPLLMRWPGHTPAGLVDSRLVGNIDIAPTVLAALRLTPTVRMDGRSLLNRAHHRSRILTEVGVAATTPAWASLVTASDQYVEYYGAGGAVEFREYYDLLQDPAQNENLLGDADTGNDPDPQVVAGLSAQLAQDRRCTAAACP